MLVKQLIFFLFLTVPLFFFSQIGMNQWRLHVPTSKPTQIATGNGTLLAAYENGLLELDLATKEQTIWTKANYLSDIAISSVYFDTYSASFWIGYENGNIDQLKGSTITNFPSLKMSNVMGNKKVIKFLSVKGNLYALTLFGVLKIDTKKMEVKDTYYPSLSESFVDFSILNDSIFALTNTHLYTAKLTDALLSNPSHWHLDERVSTRFNANYIAIASFVNKIYIVSQFNAYQKDTVFILSPTGMDPFKSDYFQDEFEIKGIKSVNNNLFVIHYGGVSFFDSSLNLVDKMYRTVSDAFIDANDAVYANGNYWILDELNGLIEWRSNWINTTYKFKGPPKNQFFSMDYCDGNMAFSGGTILRTGPTFNNAGVYVMENENWTLIDRWNQNKWKNKAYWDAGTVSINPNNTNQIAIGANCMFPISIYDKATAQVEYIYTDTNSLLIKKDENALVSDLKYAKEGDLWVLNSFTDKPLKMLTNTGVWLSFETGSESKNSFAKELTIDSEGNTWFYISNKGIIGYNTNNTVDDLSDDQTNFISDDLSSGGLHSKDITSIAVDYSDVMWIGTTNGFCVLYNASSILKNKEQPFKTQRIILNSEGKGYPMLGATSISDIKVDGGNRKWIATASAGLFLLNSDGTEIIHHFTSENSPLISNNISQLEINHATGEVFINTDLGLISFRSDASQEGDSDASTLVFPNPFKPEHTVPITIQGIKYDSDIRITDSAGNLIYKTTSNGGTAIWNGNNSLGDRVSGGVYFIWTAPNEGKGRKVGTVVVVN